MKKIIVIINVITKRYYSYYRGDSSFTSELNECLTFKTVKEAEKCLEKNILYNIYQDDNPEDKFFEIKTYYTTNKVD